ncbi:hypothetical protein [Rickettsiales endosymbiont of Stachyamoeba lipophora]|uniref:hypothetical protein n=1 Tax=Rickettsiales endosymbiont of Stachyamoeba lipophora TaxID=2486578 RepID=UPI0013DDE4EA|nr:hypothetical protein [Rickettsiales endosymbiont of Stachyamoeba lipophora]
MSNTKKEQLYSNIGHLADQHFEENLRVREREREREREFFTTTYATATLTYK